jgi:NAD(P)-dependent dehydrogenase (short-subunit alcohol dehydrogenase family)
VHCAALLESLGPIEHQSLDQWLRMLRVNAAAPFALTRACSGVLRASPQACVVFTLDTRGEDPRALWGGYAASKAALGAFFRVLADEWEDLPNVRVNAVVPGPMRSPMRRRTHPGEDPAFWPPPEALVPRFLDLLEGGPGAPRGQVLHLADPSRAPS